MNASFPYLGDLVAFSTTLSWSIGIFPFTEAARRLGPNAVNHFRLVIAVIALTILSLLFLNINFIELFTTPLPQHWLWFGLSGVIGLALGDYFSFTSFAIIGPRASSVFNTLAPAAALCAGYFVIGERINFVGLIGIAITIFGVIWLTLSKSAKSEIKHMEQHGNMRRGIITGILAAVCQGVGVVLANKGFTYEIEKTTIPAFQATWLRMICATTVIFLFTICRGKLKETVQPVLRNQDNGIPYTLIGAVFGPIMGVSLSMLTISLMHNKPSVAQTIFSLMPIIALPIAALYYKERITMKALTGAFIAIAGVVILIWRDDIIRWF